MSEYVEIESLMSAYKCPRCGHETDEWDSGFCEGCNSGYISTREARWRDAGVDYDSSRLAERKVRL